MDCHCCAWWCPLSPWSQTPPRASAVFCLFSNSEQARYRTGNSRVNDMLKSMAVLLILLAGVVHEVPLRSCCRLSHSSTLSGIGLNLLHIFQVTFHRARTCGGEAYVIGHVRETGHLLLEEDPEGWYGLTSINLFVFRSVMELESDFVCSLMNELPLLLPDYSSESDSRDGDFLAALLRPGCFCCRWSCLWNTKEKNHVSKSPEYVMDYPHKSLFPDRHKDPWDYHSKQFYNSTILEFQWKNFNSFNLMRGGTFYNRKTIITAYFASVYDKK